MSPSPTTDGAGKGPNRRKEVSMAHPGTGNALSIFSVLEVLRRRKWFVIIPALILGMGFSLFAYYQPDRYRATALLAAEQTAPPEYLKHVAPAPLRVEDHLWTVREVLFSKPVLESAAKGLNAYKNVEGAVPPAAIEEVKAGVSLKGESEHTFQISYDAGDRREAMNVANRLAKLFIEQASADRRQKSEGAASVIDEQLERLRLRLDTQSRELHSYKQKVITALPDHIDANMREAHSLRDQYSHIETKIADDEARRTALMKELRELEAKGVLDQPGMQGKTPEQTRLDDLRFREKELETRGYLGAHPDLKALRRQIGQVEQMAATQQRQTRSEPTPMDLRYVELKSELEGVTQRLSDYRREQQRIDGQIGSFSRRIEATPQHERVIEDMQREYQVGEKQFRALLDKQLDARLATGLEQSETGIAFAIVEAAGLPAAPFSPRRERLILMGIVAGLGMGLLMAFVLEQNDTTFGSADDFQAFTTMPLVGVIPAVAIKEKEGGSPVVTISDPESGAAEQYRLLAMRIQQQCAGCGTQVVTITSAVGKEGKSLTAINLAVALADTTGAKVLLIDADMRKPSINQYLNITSHAAKGFYRLLVEPEEGLEKHIVKVKNLHVIPGSLQSSDPVAALASPKARVVFERMKREYDYIIVDAPPTLPIADSHILGSMSDKVLFVVRSRETPREVFQHAVEGFDAANLLGAVLNDVDYQRSRYAYAYEYYTKSAA